MKHNNLLNKVTDNKILCEITIYLQNANVKISEDLMENSLTIICAEPILLYALVCNYLLKTPTHRLIIYM